MRTRSFRRGVALLAALRIAPALVVLAANGASLPLLPGYAYGPPRGDTYGFYAAAREFISAWAHVSHVLLAFATLLVVACAIGLALAWRAGRRAEAIAGGAVVVGLFTCLAIREMGPTGAGAVGWPIVWSLPLFPLRAAGSLTYHAAFYIGVSILLLSNIVTVVATSVISRHLIRGRLALLPPALLVVWPFVMRLVEGTGNGVYGTWLTDAGLLLYSEPLSTALVTTAIALVVLRIDSATAAGLAGALAAIATAVRVSNSTVAVVLFAGFLVARAWRSAAGYAVAGVGMVSIAAVFWSRGYSSFKNGPSEAAPNGLFSWHYMLRSWRDSVVFDWKLLALLLPFPLIGIVALRHRPRDLLVLGGTVAITALFYSLYYITALHPRFLFVALPALFILAALGIDQLMAAVRGRVTAAA
jgi:hypothetical protein